MRYITKILFALSLTFSISSCSVISSPCSSLIKEVQNKEQMGQFLFNEFELQLNRFKSNSPYPLRLKESAAELLENYVQVHQLILEKPECLVKPELENTLREGVVGIQERIAKVKRSDEEAFLWMLGDLSEAYQSMELWIKK